jgi:hypothetical protein
MMGSSSVVQWDSIGSVPDIQGQICRCSMHCSTRLSPTSLQDVQDVQDVDEIEKDVKMMKGTVFKSPPSRHFPSVYRYKTSLRVPCAIVFELESVNLDTGCRSCSKLLSILHFSHALFSYTSVPILLGLLHSLRITSDGDNLRGHLAD